MYEFNSIYCAIDWFHILINFSYAGKYRARTFGRGTVRRGTVRRKKKMLVSARLG